MSVFNRLYVKLALSLLAVFITIGTALLLLTRHAMESYYQEITQRLNASVAMYVTNELELIANGQANPEALKQLAHHAMIIHPALEVYLLDLKGNVISHALEKDALTRPAVDLKPVQAFISGHSESPLTGDDPRTPSSRKIFTASEVKSQNQLEGYVYIILEGKKRDALAHSINSSQVFRVSSVAVVACLLFGLISSLLIFYRLSNRLESLTQKVDRFYRHSPPLLSKQENGDELHRLDQAFDEMQQRIQQQVNQIKQADELRRELITNISHDLRTPLTSLQGYLETVLLKQDQLSAEELKQYLEITRDHSLRLGRLIADLFELTKLDNNVITPEIESFSIAELIQDIVQSFQLTAQQRNVDLQLEGDLEGSVVEADIQLIERVINNLLENALRHTPKGGAIIFSLKAQDEGVQVTITDNGEGIPSEDLPHIFDRFFHARNNQQVELKSTGLGLAIVKRILDLHLCRITVQSTLQKGTSFSFALPHHNPTAV